VVDPRTVLLSCVPRGLLGQQVCPAIASHEALVRYAVPGQQPGCLSG
jgi:hypothetical protein